MIAASTLATSTVAAPVATAVAPVAVGMGAPKAASAMPTEVDPRSRRATGDASGIGVAAGDAKAATARAAAARAAEARAAEARAAEARSRLPTVAASRLDDQRLTQLHGALVAERRRLNQPGKVSKDALAASLRDTESKLRTQYADKDIDFHVVVKNGKAVVKPIVG
jgi:chemotaxis protein histidine kinase CheA